MRTVVATATPELEQYVDEINSWLNEVTAEECESIIRTVLQECFGLDEEFVRTIEYGSDIVEGVQFVLFNLPLPDYPDDLIESAEYNPDGIADDPFVSAYSFISNGDRCFDVKSERFGNECAFASGLTLKEGHAVSYQGACGRHEVLFSEEGS